MRRAAALLAVALAGCGSPSPPPKPLSGRYGINAQSLLALPAADKRRQATAIAATGIRTVRLDIPWQEVEPSAGHFQTTRVDDLIAALTAENIRVHAVLDYSARWASSVPGETLALPRDPADFARFAAFAAHRWGRSISSYEIWNEPNLPSFSRGGVDPARYAALADTARRALRRADPGAPVALGGLAAAGAGYQAPEEFLRSVIAARPGLRALDAVGLHSYAPDHARTVAALQDVIGLLDALGMPRTTVELSEWGAPANGPGSLPAPTRGAYLADGARTFAALPCRVSFIALHTWTGSRFAVAAPDGSLDPAGAAWAKALAGAAPQHPC